MFHPILRFTQITFHSTHISTKLNLLKSFTPQKNSWQFYFEFIKIISMNL